MSVPIRWLYNFAVLLLQNGAAFLLQIGAKTYYKSRQLFYYILGQIYCKTGQLLQIAASLLYSGVDITYRRNYHKSVHNNILQVTIDMYQ